MTFPGIRLTPRLAVVAMLGAMLIFGSNFAISRYATQHGFSPYDLVFLRFALAGPILLPLFLRRGARDCAGLGWPRGILLAVISGAPMTLLMSVGVSLAPAAHGAALGPGTVTAVGVVYGAVLAGVLPPRLTQAGLGFVVAGLASIAYAGSTSGSASVMLGDLCFVLTGLLWGFYPVLLHRWRLDGMTGAAICAVLSLAFMPFYFALLQPRLLDVAPGLLVAMAIYQGVVNSIIGLWLWGVGVRVLGAKGTQLFPPLIPVIGTVAAIPILAEWPGPLQALGVSLIVGGLALSAYGNRPSAAADEAASTKP